MWHVLNWKSLAVLAALLLQTAAPSPAQAQGFVPWAYNSIFGTGYYGGYSGYGYRGAWAPYASGYGSPYVTNYSGYAYPYATNYGLSVSSYYGGGCGCSSCGCASGGCGTCGYAGGCASCGYGAGGCAACGYAAYGSSNCGCADCGCGNGGCANCGVVGSNCAGCANCAPAVNPNPPANNNNASPPSTFDPPNPGVGDDFRGVPRDEVRPSVAPNRPDGFEKPLPPIEPPVGPSSNHNNPGDRGAKAVPLDSVSEVLASLHIERQRVEPRTAIQSLELVRIEIAPLPVPLADTGDSRLVRR